MSRKIGQNSELSEFLKFLFLLVCLLILMPEVSYSQVNRLNLMQTSPVLEAENKVWLGTPAGLYQYDTESDSYKRFVIPVDNSNQNIRHLYYNDEWLWCILDSSLAALHIRLNEWLVFNEENGLPSSVVNGLDFTDDYVWAASENGAARFDLLLKSGRYLINLTAFRKVQLKISWWMMKTCG